MVFTTCAFLSEDILSQASYSTFDAYTSALGKTMLSPFIIPPMWSPWKWVRYRYLISAGVTPKEANPDNKRLSGAPIPASNKIRTPSVSTKKVLMDEGIPSANFKLSISSSLASAKSVLSIRRSFALSCIQVTFTPSSCKVFKPSHAIVVLSILTSSLVCFFAPPPQPTSNNTIDATTQYLHVLFFIGLLIF